MSNASGVGVCEERDVSFVMLLREVQEWLSGKASLYVKFRRFSPVSSSQSTWKKHIRPCWCWEGAGRARNNKAWVVVCQSPCLHGLHGDFSLALYGRLRRADRCAACLRRAGVVGIRSVLRPSQFRTNHLFLGKEKLSGCQHYEHLRSARR